MRQFASRVIYSVARRAVVHTWIVRIVQIVRLAPACPRLSRSRRSPHNRKSATRCERACSSCGSAHAAASSATYCRASPRCLDATRTMARPRMRTRASTALSSIGDGSASELTEDMLSPPEERGNPLGRYQHAIAPFSKTDDPAVRWFYQPPFLVVFFAACAGTAALAHYSPRFQLPNRVYDHLGVASAVAIFLVRSSVCPRAADALVDHRDAAVS